MTLTILCALCVLFIVGVLELVRLRALRRWVQAERERREVVRGRPPRMPDRYEMLGDTAAPCHGLERWKTPDRAPHAWRLVMRQDQPSGDHVVEVCDVCGGIRRRPFKEETT